MSSWEGLSAGRSQQLELRGVHLPSLPWALCAHASLIPTPHTDTHQTTLLCLNAGQRTHFTTSLSTRVRH